MSVVAEHVPTEVNEPEAVFFTKLDSVLYQYPHHKALIVLGMTTILS